MTHSTEMRSKALRSLYDEHIGDDPERLASLEREILNAEVARHLYRLREESGLSQEEFAERAGVDAEIISDLEAADYEGDSLELLKKIAAALGKRVEVKDLTHQSSDRAEGATLSQGIGLAVY